MENVKNRRRNYYIDRQFQLNFIIKFCALVLIGSAISGIIIYFMSKTTVCTTFENSKLIMKSTADYILPSVLFSSIISVILIGLAAIAVTLFASHKIAGPLYRLDKDVQEITSGNLAITFRLRDGDEIRPLASSLNDMVGAIRGRVVEIGKSLDKLESSAGLTKEDRTIVEQMKISVDKFKI